MRLGVVLYLACGLVFAVASARWYPWLAGRAGRVVGGVAQGFVWPVGIVAWVYVARQDRKVRDG